MVAFQALDEDGPPEIPEDRALSSEMQGNFQRRVGLIERHLLPVGPDPVLVKQVNRLFLVLKSAGEQDEEAAEERLTIYCEQVQDCPLFAIQRAVADFISGKQGDKKWVPTPAELRAAAQAHMTPLRAEKHKIERVLAARVIGAPERDKRVETLAHVNETLRQLRANTASGSPGRRVPPPVDEAQAATDALNELVANPRPLPQMGESLRYTLESQGRIKPRPPADHDADMAVHRETE